MNKRIKRKWLKALRSGEYVQGKNFLCKRVNRTDHFCCLGVLVNETVGFDEVPSEDGYTALIEDCLLLPPHQLTNGFGLDMEDVDLLANLNDKGESFETIADWIETHL